MQVLSEFQDLSLVSKPGGCYTRKRIAQKCGVAERRDHGRRWQKVALEHLRYILALSAWYCFCQSYDPSIHTIIQNVTF